MWELTITSKQKGYSENKLKLKFEDIASITDYINMIHKAKREDTEFTYVIKEVENESI